MRPLRATSVTAPEKLPASMWRCTSSATCFSRAVESPTSSGFADGAPAENAVAVIVAQASSTSRFVDRFVHRMVIPPVYAESVRAADGERYFNFFECVSQFGFVQSPHLSPTNISDAFLLPLSCQSSHATATFANSPPPGWKYVAEWPALLRAP